MRSIALLFFCCIGFSVHAQSVERKVINTAGTTYANGGIRLKVSVGEPVVGLINNDTATILSQGFFSGFYKKVMPDPPNPPLPFDTTAIQPNPDGYSIYPNPVKTNLFIKGDLVLINQVQFFDIAGHRLLSRRPGPGSAVSVQNLPPGFYIGKITGFSDEVMAVFKIIKL